MARADMQLGLSNSHSGMHIQFGELFFVFVTSHQCIKVPPSNKEARA